MMSCDRLTKYSSDFICTFFQGWLTPANKMWPGSGRVDEVLGDRHVVATLYDKLADIKKKS